MKTTAQRIVEVIAQLDEVKNELNRGGELTAAGHVQVVIRELLLVLERMETAQACCGRRSA